MTRIAITLTCLCGLLAGGCGTELPARYVIERDLGDYHFRRFQRALHGDIPVASNPGRSYSAAYMRQRGGTLQIVSALVTVYEHPERLTETVRAQLAALPGYTLSSPSIAGQFAWQLRADAEPTYWIWPSGSHLVKLGAPAGQDVPQSIASAYASLYPSDLDRHGHALPGATSGGRELEEAEDGTPPAPSAPSPAPAPGALAESGPAR